eukprot:907736-Amorphochlora_amoeboformis.AAC.1
MTACFSSIAAIGGFGMYVFGVARLPSRALRGSRLAAGKKSSNVTRVTRREGGNAPAMFVGGVPGVPGDTLADNFVPDNETNR